MAESGNGAGAPSDERLRTEIVNLFQYVERLRKELAKMSGRRSDQTAFETMSDQLDAVVTNTASATDTILRSAEEITDLTGALSGEADPAKIKALCDEIGGKSVAIMEACSFQDITGQRITKIVQSMRFVEERVEAMANIWGREEIEALGQEIAPELDPDDESQLLDGPQLPGQEVSQDDIDKLFA